MVSRYGTATVVRSFQLGERFGQELAAVLPARVAGVLPVAESCEEVASALQARVAAGEVSAVDAARAGAVLGVAAREWVAAAVCDTLGGLGYAVRAVAGPVTGVWAERGDEVFAVEVHDGGGFAFDVAGVDPSGCGARVEEVLAGLAARGVRSEPVVAVHDDPRGGRLLRRVAAGARGPVAGRSGATARRVRG